MHLPEVWDCSSGPQSHRENDKHPRNTKINSLPQGIVQQLAIQYQIASPEIFCKLPLTEHDIFIHFRIYTYIHMYIYM